MKQQLWVFSLSLVILGGGESFAGDFLDGITRNEIKSACRVRNICNAQYKFYIKNKSFSKDLKTLYDHSLVSKELSSGILEGYKFATSSNKGSIVVSGTPIDRKVNKRVFEYDGGIETLKKRNGVPFIGSYFVGKKKNVVILYPLDFVIKASDKWHLPKGYVFKVPVKTLIIAEGVVKIGKKWKYHGPEGSSEKSFRDHRIVKGKAKVGCLLAGIVTNGAVGYDRHYFGSNDEIIKLTLPEKKRIAFQLNDTGLSNNTGNIHIYTIKLQLK